jgi:diguanylate cyclase (GGDEF)-like protein/PAS domain S-box-containing protein
MSSSWMSMFGHRIARMPVGRLVIGLLSVLVVVGMVAAAVFARQSADTHRRAQVLAEQVHASTQELSALKWRADADVLARTADLSLGGSLVREGARIVSELNTEIARLQRLQPGVDAQRLERDVQATYAGGMQALALAAGHRRLSQGTLTTMQDTFQPLVDRIDADARRIALHQQAVAARALNRSLAAEIGSLLLGVVVLAALGLRLGQLRRRAALAAQARAVERRSDQRIRALVEHSSDVIMVLGRDLRIRWQAASVRRLLGVEPESLVGSSIASISHPADKALVEGFLRARLDEGTPGTLRSRLRHRDGRWRYVETIAENRLADPAVEGLVLSLRDVSERKEFEDQLRHQAFHDSLTGLANRALFEDRLRQAVARTLRTKRTLAVLFLDIDDFKTINDSLGHDAGDVLLNAVAASIDSVVRPSDTPARLGGDEFAILVDGIESHEEAHRIARRVLDVLSQPVTLGDHDLIVTASIGVAFGDEPAQAGELLRNADMAMYAAKEHGKGSIRTFEQAMHRRAVKRLALRAELQRALINGEFELDYQPIVRLQTGSIVGIEALVRWQHPTRGRLGPDQFIALAEESGLIVSLGRWVLEQACADTRKWTLALDRGEPLFVSVNVSIRQLRERDFPEVVANALDRTALEHPSLVLEITESLLADDPEAVIRQLRTLKQLGVRIAIDDFGTGYSALSQLQDLPIDILKIAKAFIDRLDAEDAKANLVQGIVNLGESLHLDVIAEGIEQPQQAERLKAMRSPLGQGFLFSRPTARDATLALLQTRNPFIARGR